MTHQLHSLNQNTSLSCHVLSSFQQYRRFLKVPFFSKIYNHAKRKATVAGANLTPTSQFRTAVMSLLLIT